MPATQSQQKAIDCKGRPLFIQAGAGTGKTFTLTKKLGYGLSPESGPIIPGVENVLTTTFTEKAAGELLGRVRAELRSRGLDKEALQIDGAWISTIHSMCNAMLSAHALQAGIDPGVELLTEEADSLLMLAAFEELLDNAQTSAKMDALAQDLGFEKAYTAVMELARTLNMAPGTEFQRGPAPQTSPRSEAWGLMVVLDACCKALEEAEIDSASEAYVKRYKKILQIAEVLAACSEREELTWLELAQALEGCSVPKGGNSKAFKDAINEAHEAVCGVRSYASTGAAYESLGLAIELAAWLANEHRSLKRLQGACDTDDLLVETHRLITSNPDIAEQYRQRFKSIMVDEFQDTDPLQTKIVEAISDDGLTSLTVVGDAQQSIYGFRGADLETYKSVRAQMAQAGSMEVSLDTNYRSHPHILSFVEQVFSTPAFFGEDFLRITAGPDNVRNLPWLASDAPRVYMLLAAGVKDGRKHTSADDLRLAEAEMIAEKFAAYAREGAEYGDMAILMSSTKKAAPYLAALRRRSIPCAISGGSDFYLQPEVKTICNLLRVIENRDDDRPMLELLASPMFDISDDDLLALRLVSRRELEIDPLDVRPRRSLFDALQHQAELIPADDDALVRAYQVLNEAVERSRYESLSRVVERAVWNSGWMASLQQQGAQGCAVRANIVCVEDLLDQYEEESGIAPLLAAERLRTLCEGAEEGRQVRGKPGRMVTLKNDTVQIMTIHASKGLEFPVVAVAQYARANRGSSGKVRVMSEGSQRYLNLAPTFQGESYADVKECFAQEALETDSLANACDAEAFASYSSELVSSRENQEQQRLLYVGLTRARDVLLLVSSDSGFASTKELGSGLFKAVAEACFEHGMPPQDTIVTSANGTVIGVEICEVPLEGNQGAQDEEVPATALHYLAQCREGLSLRNRTLSERRIHSYSSIAHRDEPCELSEYPVLHDPAAQPDTVSSFGSAFHLVAQWLALNPDGNGIDARIEAAAKRYGLEASDACRLHKTLETWRTSELFGRAMAYAHVAPEQAFCVRVGETPLEGYIDLLCTNPNASSALIVDYKTGESGEGNVLRKRYELQANCYAFAVLASGLCSEVEVVFVRPEVELEQVVFQFKSQQLEQIEQLILGA